jgi:hypothetical protein
MFVRLIFLALLASASYALVDEAQAVLQEAQDYVKSLDEFDHEWKSECHISSGESCDLTKFAKDETTMVFPGGETRCIFSNTPNFAFQVIISSRLFVWMIKRRFIHKFLC